MTNFEIGDDVFGYSNDGAIQEYTVADSDKIAKKPTKLNWGESASLVVAGNTSLQCLKNNGLKSGENLLIIGASGGTGTFGVFLGKHFGAKVTGVCSTANIGLVKSLGADNIADYRNPNYIEELK